MNNYVVKNNDVSLKVEITNIRWKGIHKFQVKNFDSTDADEDLVLNVDGEKLHCHSQILSQNSTIFRDMIKGSQGSCEISLKDSIPVEDLRELLHYLYLPCEPVDDHNLRQLLHWGRKYTALEIPIEIFLLFWRYIRHSKNYWVRETIQRRQNTSPPELRNDTVLL
ncbi:unnamed protein product [Auanema sp. JU1783]|nr:unnamed protein product [Auanema sp. JU1783]